MLELGIALHSVLIGVALGVSDSAAAVRPLATALVFHQTFEGFALGGALADAGHDGCPPWSARHPPPNPHTHIFLGTRPCSPHWGEGNGAALLGEILL